MRYLLLAVSLCIGVTGCYTMVYPPANDLVSGYGANGSVLTVPDSVSGNNITIINQNQIIFDRYYQDPYYQRGGFFGGSGCWDPYYYNPNRYHRVNYWHHGRYQSGNSSGTITPKPKTPRRKKDYRRSEVPPNNSPKSTEVINMQASALTAIYVKSKPVQPVQPEPNKITKAQVTDPDDNRWALRTVSAPNASDTGKQLDEKTPRRGNSRER